MRLPSDKTFKFFRDLVIFLVAVTGAVWQLIILPHPDEVALGFVALIFFGPAGLHLLDTRPSKELPPSEDS